MWACRFRAKWIEFRESHSQPTPVVTKSDRVMEETYPYLEEYWDIESGFYQYRPAERKYARKYTLKCISFEGGKPIGTTSYYKFRKKGLTPPRVGEAIEIDPTIAKDLMEDI